MARMITAYVVTAIVFLGIDYVWLSKVAKSFYFDRLGDMVLDKPKMGAAALFYAVYVVGIVIFAVAPALKGSGSATTAALYGALFGFFAYATYDMTNYATLKNWPVVITAVDIVWGTVLTGVSALAGYLVTRAIFPA
ncbi:putative membrane protein [Rhodobium orientis]|uniref:DUF2177 domain-containing protein n=1 Tax=Rhodobium orientis TaxID=34017 RepID=A0A327JS09_9HYPH|nr:DUF2177 family protein [Rhodobium orientis]MBB4303478.1 putative membrane protein [Rhodobium orientis]MBK5950411.1 hypothetical protein [Rhodobium orientis]RAI28405.1 hypothetical protein CH339_07020 [Rhodobium orientis]